MVPWKTGKASLSSSFFFHVQLAVDLLHEQTRRAFVLKKQTNKQTNEQKKQQQKTCHCLVFTCCKCHGERWWWSRADSSQTRSFWKVGGQFLHAYRSTDKATNTTEPPTCRIETATSSTMLYQSFSPLLCRCRAFPSRLCQTLIVDIRLRAPVPLFRLINGLTTVAQRAKTTVATTKLFLSFLSECPSSISKTFIKATRAVDPWLKHGFWMLRHVHGPKVFTRCPWTHGLHTLPMDPRSSHVARGPKVFTRCPWTQGLHTLPMDPRSSRVEAVQHMWHSWVSKRCCHPRLAANQGCWARSIQRCMVVQKEPF